MSEARGLRPVGDWFAAEVQVPVDVAVLNFVVQYYEHYDNNYGADFKAAVQVDSEGRCVHLLQSCACSRSQGAHMHPCEVQNVWSSTVHPLQSSSKSSAVSASTWLLVPPLNGDLHGP